MKYRSKPTVIEAVQFLPLTDHKLKLPEGVTGIHSPGADNWAYEGCMFYVTTIQGQKVPVSEGEWIIAEPDGIHHYPCAPDVFAARYEPVD